MSCTASASIKVFSMISARALNLGAHVLGDSSALVMMSSIQVRLP